MSGGLPSLLLLVVLVLLVGPILGIAAFAKVRRLEESQRTRSTGSLESLTQRVYALERALAKRTSAVAPPPAPPVPLPKPIPLPQTESVAPPSALPPILATPAPVAPRPMASPIFTPAAPLPKSANSAREAELESLVAGHWFLYAGMLAILFAVTFFIKYAFDNHWVGPQGRIAIGIAIGAALVVSSYLLLQRKYRYFSEGIAALGAAVLYLSLWAGWHYYQLFSQNVAFAFMIVVTAAMAIIAIGRDSERIALLAALGGLLTPTLLSTGHDQELVLFGYLAILDAGLLAIAWRRRWRWVAGLQFAATWIYFWGWYSDFYAAERLVLTASFATLFFLFLVAIPVLRSRTAGSLFAEEAVFVPLNALLYLLALYEMLWPDDRWSLTLAVLALAALHLVFLRLLPVSGAGRTARMLFAGVALTCATLAVPIRLDGKWITMALAIEGALLIWSGFSAPLFGLRAAGLLLFAIIATRLVLFPIPAPRAFWNPRFATFAIAVACFAFAVFQQRQSSIMLTDGEASVFDILAVAVNVYAIAALSLETWTFVGRMPQLGIDRWVAQELALSLVWTLYAIALLAFGILRKLPMLRWQGLVLMAVVVGKVFFFDLSSLDKFYRVVSFLVLGMALLVVSFYYQKNRPRGAREGPGA
ncbi:MAG TPA: DUF2339 domain-containing protein [Candidatus Acidoferrales bacterium]|nr:DUF2339 domain-containing protein [Candidatus Acidoferrales bacterium]